MNHENLSAVKAYLEHGLRQASPRQRIEGAITIYKESHRLVDNWPYYLDERGLYVLDDDIDGHLIKTHVGGLIERDSRIGALEGQVFDQVENWARQNDSGWAIWWSPQAREAKHLSHKVIIHQIAYEFGSMRKSVLSSALPFEAGEASFLQAVHTLFPQTRQFRELESLRPVLITIDEDFDVNLVIEAIISLDHNVLKNSPLGEEELLVRASRVATLMSSQTSAQKIALEMYRQGLIGEHALTCPPAVGGRTFSELVVFGREKYVRNCGVCGAKIEARIAPGFKCPNCNEVYKGVC